MTEATKDLPLALSVDGRRNAKTFWCRDMQQRRFYAPCAALVDRVRVGEAFAESETCGKLSISCTAALMRQEEHEELRSIYFQERVRLGDSAPARGIIQYVKTRQKPTATIKVSAGSGLDLDKGFDIGGYADVVNDLMNADAQKSVPAAQKVEFLPGETPLQAARRAMLCKQE